MRRVSMAWRSLLARAFTHRGGSPLEARSLLLTAVAVAMLSSCSGTSDELATGASALVSSSPGVGGSGAGARGGLTLVGQRAGATPFLAVLELAASPDCVLERVRFAIEPKPGSVTRAVSAEYESAYLERRGFFDPAAGTLSMPVFGLYQGRENTVGLSYDCAGGPPRAVVARVPTAAWVDPTGGAYTSPRVVLARSPATRLSYDFILLKGSATRDAPVIVDTDGEVRWVGTAGLSSFSSAFFENRVYAATGTGLARMELDGASTVLADYARLGITSTDHHNYDPGKYGLLLEVDETHAFESTIVEVDRDGALLKTWRLADIVGAAMIAGGDDPSAFVRASADWFHNNACAYSEREDALIVSSRENFVIALDYETGAIRWILGDQTKAWYQYPSLRRFALTLVGDSLPPIGQHAVSLAKDGDLLLFDDGTPSLNQTPAGASRPYSAPRKYRIDAKKMTALEAWSYLASPSIYSAFCSSVYEDARDNYLIDYTLHGDLVGLDAHGDEAFHYVYSTSFGCGLAWNAVPIHLEDVRYDCATSPNVQAGVAAALGAPLPALAGAVPPHGRRAACGGEGAIPGGR